MNALDQISVIIAGVAWPIVFEILGKLGLANRGAQWAAVILSYVIAAVVIVATGGTVSATSLLANGSELAIIAQLVYRQALKPKLGAGA